MFTFIWNIETNMQLNLDYEHINRIRTNQNSSFFFWILFFLIRNFQRNRKINKIYTNSNWKKVRERNKITVIGYVNIMYIDEDQTMRIHKNEK